jgi:hypothetical protein
MSPAAVIAGLFAAVACAASAGCTIDALPAVVAPPPPPTTADPVADDPSLVERATSCGRHWTETCAGVADALQTGCPGDKAECSVLSNRVQAAGAEAVCEEGSVAECQAACDSRKPYACVLLAQIARDGTRVQKSDSAADAILAASCTQGAVESCVERALWLRASAPRDAATLAMQACRGDDVGLAVVGCALWMQLLEEKAFDVVRAERVEGLRQVCQREETGWLKPGAPIHTRESTVLYHGGACGRLKDLGTSAP